jgi:hypothetical protein
MAVCLSLVGLSICFLLYDELRRTPRLLSLKTGMSVPRSPTLRTRSLMGGMTSQPPSWTLRQRSQVCACVFVGGYVGVVTMEVFVDFRAGVIS